MDITSLIIIGVVLIVISGLFLFSRSNDNKENYLVLFFDWLRNTVEHANPSLFALIATFVPYLSPLPVAVMTSTSAKEFLGFTGTTAGIFAFVLEALGLLLTSILVEAIVEAIRGKNIKSLGMIIVFSVLMVFYIYILVSLNVTLEGASIGSQANIADPAVYSKVITLICFLPAISGFLNGYYKLNLEYRSRLEKEQIENKASEKDEKRFNAEQELKRLAFESEQRLKQLEIDGKFQQANDERKVQEKLERKRLNLEKSRIESQSNTAKTNVPEEVDSKYSSGDWRKIRPNLSAEELDHIAHMTPEQIDNLALETGKTRKTIQNWKNAARKELGFALPKNITEYINMNNRFPSGEEITAMGVSPEEAAIFIRDNQDVILNKNLLSPETIQLALDSLNK